MAIITSYPSAQPEAPDHILGVRAEDEGMPTKLFPIQDLITLVSEEIPAGPQGPQGPQGPTGPQGIPGVSGTYGLFAQTALGTPIISSSGEASILGAGVGTLSIPANTFQVGDSFTAKVCGYLSCANNQDIHIRVKSDGNIIADAGVFRLSITTNKYFEINLDFTIANIGGPGVAKLFTNGQFTYNKNANSNIDGTNFASVDSTVFNTTILNTLSITAQWVTSDASNSIQSQNAVLTKVY